MVPSGQKVQALSHLRVYIKHTAGLILPETGVRAKMTEHGIVMKSDASAGRVPPTAILCEPAVGFFGNTSITFGHDARPHENVVVNLTMVPYMQLHPGDTIRIHLADFSGPFESTTVPFRNRSTSLLQILPCTNPHVDELASFTLD